MFVDEIRGNGLQRIQGEARPPVGSAASGLTDAQRSVLLRRLAEPVDCVYHPCFDEPDIERRLLQPIEAPAPQRRTRRRTRDAADDLLVGHSRVALTSEQERHLFLRLNLARYRILQVIRGSEGRSLTAGEVRDLLRWETVAEETRNEIVRANMPLVLAMARRTRIISVDLAEMVSEGNMALLRSVEKFDCARGFKFSTYACRSILKSFSRVATRTARHRACFPTEFDPTLEKADLTGERRRDNEQRNMSDLRWILGENLASLSDVERTVIRARFALAEQEDKAGEPVKAKTLEQVGELIGVTKERVRQIQNKALAKLKTMLEEGAAAS